MRIKIKWYGNVTGCFYYFQLSLLYVKIRTITLQPEIELDTVSKGFCLLLGQCVIDNS